MRSVPCFECSNFFLTVIDYGAFWLFPVLTITNKTAENKHLDVFVWIYPLIFSGIYAKGCDYWILWQIRVQFFKINEKMFPE